MPKAKFKSPTVFTQSKIDEALNFFIKKYQFSLTNGIVSAEALNYCINYLARHHNNLIGWDHRIYLKNVTFDVGPARPDSLRSYRDEKIVYLLNQIFEFSTRWSVIALNNVTILQDGNHYPLSSYCILEFLTQLTPSSRDENARISISHQLIIKNAEFHSWGWIHFLIARPRCHTLVLKLLVDAELTDNLIILSQSLHYAKIKVLEIKNSEFSLECYQALHELLFKNYYLEQLHINEPTNPESLVFFKKIEECLAKGETGKQRFDRERFNQDEFLRLFNEVKNALQHETDEDKIKLFRKKIKFMLEQKEREGDAIVREKITFNYIPLIPKVHAVYYDHAEYIVGRLPLFRLDLNRSVANRVNTLGYYLLEEALSGNDHFMMNCLLDNGTANLFEQQAGEKPILMQIYENPDFKQVILDHIYLRKTLISMAEKILENYSKSKKIMVELGHSLINYTKRLEKIIYSYKLSSFERLLNRLRERFELPNPSKHREREFIEIYWRIGKSLTLFHNNGEVTVDSVSNAQSTLDEIIAISEHADSGWLCGSELHYKLTKRLDLLKEAMDEDTNSLGREIKDKHKPTKKAFNNAEGHLETFFTNTNLKRQHSKTSKLDEPESSTGFSPKR